MLQEYRADLHVHTCLSPCGELEMTPGAVIGACEKHHIDIMAVCDHNTAENIQGVMDAAEGTSVKVIPGMEVTTEEEVHILALFPDALRVNSFQEDVYAHLLPGENDEDLFGIQVVANASDEVEKISHRLLIAGTTLSLRHVVSRIHALDGLAIASHIDRASYSILSQLGFIPDDVELDALEISSRGNTETWRARLEISNRWPFIKSSDAHRLEEIGQSMTTFMIEAPTLEEIRKGLKFLDSRRLVEEGAAR